MTDSKFPDFQAGSERASTHAVTAIAGANIVYESAGMYASLLGTCPESLLLDNDLLGASMRMTKGFSDDSEESLCFETIKDVCLNDKAHYLGSDQTIDVMQSEYIYPELSDRDSPNDWADMGKPSHFREGNSTKKRNIVRVFSKITSVMLWIKKYATSSILN